MFRNNRMRKGAKSRERGATMPEMALGGVLFFTVLFGILEFSRALTTYNALSDAVRRGARYAAMNPSSQVAAVQNMVVYGTPTAGAQPIAVGLTTGQVSVQYTDFSLATGSVRVGITNYQFQFLIPMFGATYTMRPFWAAARAESAGIIPSSI
jgi:Flp pilus assembly protein TadG